MVARAERPSESTRIVLPVAKDDSNVPVTAVPQVYISWHDEPSAGLVITSEVAELTVTETGAEVAVEPELSVAFAVIEYVPIGTLLQLAVYGAVVDDPIKVLPWKKSTRMMVPSGSLAVAASGIVPGAIKLSVTVGDVSVTTGG